MGERVSSCDAQAEVKRTKIWSAACTARFSVSYHMGEQQAAASSATEPQRPRPAASGGRLVFPPRPPSGRKADFTELGELPLEHRRIEAHLWRSRPQEWLPAVESPAPRRPLLRPPRSRASYTLRAKRLGRETCARGDRRCRCR